MKVPQELIEAATRKGIVPGAVVRCAYIRQNTFIVPEWERIEGDDSISTIDLVDMTREGAHHGKNYGYLKFRDTWCEVIQPAPSQGLEEGMATECSPAMRAAIIERAVAIGVNVYGSTKYPFTADEFPNLTWSGSVMDGTCATPQGHGKWLPNHEFLARLEATAKKPKPIKIGEWNVKFEQGSIEVGCQRIANETVRAIAAKLQD